MSKLTRVEALVLRETSTSIPVSVFEYEIDVLKEIHGEANVIETGREEETVEGLDAATAHDGLRRKYRGNEAAVLQVYRNPSVLAKASGLPAGDGSKTVAQSVQRKPAKKAAK